LKPWIILIVLLVAFFGAYQWLQSTPTGLEREEMSPSEVTGHGKLKQSTLTPGRVVELHTSKGQIDFILFENDCPKTTSRVAELVAGGSYNGVPFNRVEKTGLIQTALPKGRLATIPREVRLGLLHAKGAVGMARKTDPNSGEGSIYILIEPWPHLDYDYTVFGRLTRGMDVAMKIKKGDVISKAVLRPLTAEDRKRFETVLTIESKRKTE